MQNDHLCPNNRQFNQEPSIPLCRLLATSKVRKKVKNICHFILLQESRMHSTILRMKLKEASTDGSIRLIIPIISRKGLCLQPVCRIHSHDSQVIFHTVNILAHLPAFFTTFQIKITLDNLMCFICIQELGDRVYKTGLHEHVLVK